MAKKKAKEKVAPAPLKSPVRLELVIVPDDSGLRFKEVVGMFVFKYPDDPFAGGAEKAPVTLDAKDHAFLQDLFDGCLNKFIEKHKTQGRAHGIAENAKTQRLQGSPR